MSLFIDPDDEQVRAASAAGADAVELHTGAYAEAWGDAARTARELARLSEAALAAHREGLAVHAGHGLNLRNLPPVCRLPHLEELNIGHALVGRALFVGMEASVADYKNLIAEAAALR